MEREQEYQRAYHKEYHLQRHFGLSVEDFDSMMTDQNGACSICRKPFTKTPNVDHDHETGAVRALLCLRCNMGLGHFDDEPALLEEAALYLRHHKEKSSAS